MKIKIHHAAMIGGQDYKKGLHHIDDKHLYDQMLVLMLKGKSAEMIEGPSDKVKEPQMPKAPAKPPVEDIKEEPASPGFDQASADGATPAAGESSEPKVEPKKKSASKKKAAEAKTEPKAE